MGPDRPDRSRTSSSDVPGRRTGTYRRAERAAPVATRGLMVESQLSSPPLQSRIADCKIAEVSSAPLIGRTTQCLPRLGHAFGSGGEHDALRQHHGQRPPLRSRRRAAAAAGSLSPRHARPDRHEDRLRHEPVRLLHGAARWRGGEVVHVPRGAGGRFVGHHDRRARAGRPARSDPGGVLGEARPAVRLLHAGDDLRDAARCSRRNSNPSPEQIRHALEGNLCRCTGYQNIVRSVQAAAAAGGR